MRSLIWFWIVAAPAIALFAESRHAGSAAPSDIEKRSVGRRRARRLASGDADGRRRRPLHLASAVTAEELDELSDYFVSDEIGLPLLARNPAPLSSLFHIPTVVAMPRLADHPAPLSSFFRMPTLVREVGRPSRGPQDSPVDDRSVRQPWWASSVSSRQAGRGEGDSVN